MPATDFDTWNPVLHINVASGALPSSELRSRATKITYVDRIHQFDTIELEMMNGDGILTRPEYLGVGMVLRIRMGYLDGAFPWRSFIINRVNGGVGVYGNADRNVGEQESTVVYHGRNRNAPGGRPSGQIRLRKRTPPGRYIGERDAQGRTRKPDKVYPPTSDITGQDALLGKLTKTRYIPGKTSSEVVTEVARRNGFKGDKAVVQPTSDRLEGATIRPGMSDMEFLQILAERHHFEAEIRDDRLHWHSPGWLGDAPGGVVETLFYGGGPDSLGLSIDVDYRLPAPSSVKSARHDPVMGLYNSTDTKFNSGMKRLEVGAFLVEWMQEPARAPYILRDIVEPTLADNLVQVSAKTAHSFVERHLKAFTLTVQCTGNPRLLAGCLVNIKGTGSPFVDRRWEIEEAQHIFTNTGGYVTNIKLRLPKKQGKKGPMAMYTSRDSLFDSAMKVLHTGMMLVEGFGSIAPASASVRGK